MKKRHAHVENMSPDEHGRRELQDNKEWETDDTSKASTTTDDVSTVSPSSVSGSRLARAHRSKLCREVWYVALKTGASKCGYQAARQLQTLEDLQGGH